MIAHPPGEEIQFDWLELPNPLEGWGVRERPTCWWGRSLIRIMDGTSPSTVQIARQRPDRTKGDRVDRTAPRRHARCSMTCTYDQAQTLVCDQAFTVAAVDPATGQLLWVLKNGEGDRKVSKVSALWHGSYARGVGGPVALDTRASADMRTKPETAPLLVGAYAGLVLDDNRLWSYPAGG